MNGNMVLHLIFDLNKFIPAPGAKEMEEKKEVIPKRTNALMMLE